MDQIIPTSYRCAYCGEENEAMVDTSGGPVQTYTEDCSICCRPNVLRIRIENEEIFISVDFEG